MNTQRTIVSLAAMFLLSASGQAVNAQTTFGSLFGPPAFIDIGIRPYDVKVADLNGDGWMDIVVANRGEAGVVSRPANGTVSVLLADGAGGFLAPTTLSVLIVEPVSVALDDLNNDGLDDLVVANGSDESVLAFINTGNPAQPFNPSMTPFRNVIVPGNGVSGTVGSVDLGLVDGDGNVDAVSVVFDNPQGNNRLSFLQGNGDGTFAAPAHQGANAAQMRFVHLANLTGNGVSNSTTDAIVVSQSPFFPVQIGEGDGMGAFSFNVSLDVPGSNERNMSAAVADVDGDGKNDIVVTTLGFGNQVSFDDPNFIPSTSVTLFRNTGFSNSIAFAPGVSIPTGEFPYSIAMDDLNGDNLPDAAITHRNTDTVDVSILLNNGNGGFDAPLEFVFDQGIGFSPRSIALADIDNDGDLDLITTRKRDNEMLAIGANGNLVIFRNLTINTVFADLNGDGIVNGGDLAILLIQWTGDTLCQAPNPCTADLNSDGKVNGSDLAILLINWTDGNPPAAMAQGDGVGGMTGSGVVGNDASAPAQQAQSNVPWVLAHYGFNSVSSYMFWLDSLTSDELAAHIVEVLELIQNN